MTSNSLIRRAEANSNVLSKYGDSVPLVNALQKSFSNKNTLTITCRHTCSNLAKTVLFVGCVAGASTFVGVCKEYAKDNRALFFSCATASIITYSFLDIWAYLKWLAITNSSPIDIEFNQVQKADLIKFNSLKVGTLCVGIIAQVPLAFVAYKGNNNSLLAFNLLLLAASGIPALSLLLSTKHLVNKCNNKTERALLKSQENLSALLAAGIANLLSKPLELQLELLEKLLNKTTFEDQSSLDSLLTEMFVFPHNSENKNCLKKVNPLSIGENTAKIIGAACAVSRLILYGAIAYNAGESFSKGDPIALAITSACLVVVSTTNITFNVLTNTAARTVRSAISFFQRKQRPTLSSILHPYISILKTPPGVVCSLLTLLPLLDLPEQYLPDSKALIITTQFGFGIGTFLLYINALNDLSDQLLLQPAWTDTEGKQLISLFSGLKLFQETLEKSSLVNVSLLLEILPKEIFNESIKSLELSKEKIKEYLENNAPEKIEVNLEIIDII